MEHYLYISNLYAIPCLPLPSHTTISPFKYLLFQVTLPLNEVYGLVLTFCELELYEIIEYFFYFNLT